MKENWEGIRDPNEPEMESPQDKQKHLNCHIGFSVDNWNCYIDCTFWNGKRCTEDDDEFTEEEIKLIRKGREEALRGETVPLRSLWKD